MRTKVIFTAIFLILIMSTTIFAIEPNERLIGRYSTKIEGSENKLHNIQLASYAIDETIVYPEGVFSYNEALGPTTEDRGYKIGKIFIDGKELDGVGGGVCQVSSTLYNSVLQAKLDIIERHPHSKEVTYVPKDKDAATSYGGIDFKFLNDTTLPIRINSYIYDSYIYVELFFIYL